MGTKFEMAMGEGQPNEMPGGFGTTGHIKDTEFVRSRLAVKEAWKPEIDRINTYEVIRPMPALVGEVGPQVDLVANRYLPGGEFQIEMKIPASERGNYIKFIESREVK